MNPDLLDRYCGCLLAGAAGDALGAPLEFYSTSKIRRLFGVDGLDHFIEGDGSSGLITDDTQMTLFTAEGILRAHHRAMQKGILGAQTALIYQSYLRWLHTQGGRPIRIPDGYGLYSVESGWLIRQKELFESRAPGVTCLSALRSGNCGTLDEPINDSKGCGGIMRVAPIGLFYHENIQQAFQVACEAAAITHSHPSGYLSAGCLAAVIACILQRQSLPEAIVTTASILRARKNHQECLDAIEKAVALYDHGAAPSAENIESLGNAWVGEETLAISLFCSLHHQNDLRAGVVAASNHGGDCDSTGAVTGNILGALLGKTAIPVEWLQNLKQAGLVEQVARDLFTRVKGDSEFEDPEWAMKYPPY